MTKSNKEAVIDILLPKKLKYSTLFYTIGDYIIIFVVIAYITIVLLTCSSITKYRNKWLFKILIYRLIYAIIITISVTYINSLKA